VSERAGKSVDGLTAADFELYDAGVRRSFELESSASPALSLVVAIQTTSISGPALAKIQKIGSLVQPLLAGERGRAAVMTYSDEVKLRQDFTSDSALVTAAFRKLEPDGGGAAMHQAVLEATKLLSARDDSSRRVLILIGESKDRSSKARLEEAISVAQQANVIIYPVSYSAYWTAFTSKGAEQFESGKPVYQPGSGGGGLLAIFSEIGRAGSKNGHEAMARYTGGLHLSFVKLSGLEKALLAAGEDLHSQYLLTFRPSPNPDGTTGYRDIRVRVRGCPDCQIRHRPGYWQVASASP